MENALRARVGGAAGVISCAEMCWQARAEMVASFRLLSVCGQAGIMGVLGQPGEFGRDILRENIAL